MPNALSGFYHDLGGRRPQILAFLRKFCQEDTGVIFDGTDILSASKRMDLPRLSKVKSGGFGTAVNIMFGYSLAAGLANYYRLPPGSIKDVKAFKICAQEYGVSVIMALRRNTKGLDYTPFANRDNKGALGHFWYSGRVIWYHRQQLFGHTAYLYLDEKLRVEEQEDYLRKADDPENDHYTTKLIERYSPRDMIKIMERLRSVYVNAKWHTTKLTSKEQRLLTAVGIDIT